MRTVLLAGFEAFDGARVNPAQLAVEALASEQLHETDLRTTILPVSYGRVGAALDAALGATRPDVVIAVGQASGRADIAIERVAINIDDAVLADNDGVAQGDSPIVINGPVAYLSSLPVKAIAARVRADGIPASISYSAGAFLCNHVFYLLCHRAMLTGHRMRVGFVHVPALPEQALGRPEMPTMSLATIVTALRSVIIAASETEWSVGANLEATGQRG